MIAILCCSLLTCVLVGCQLAQEQENAGTNAYEDRLAGVLVTTEHIDLLDFESFFNDNFNGMPDGEVTVDGDTQRYQGRLYASLTARTLTNKETGETFETEEYAFPGIDGIPYFSATIPASAEHESYETTISDPAISDGKVDSYYGDETSSTTMEGTIYVLPAGRERTYYFNPVYQGADGRVYLTTGNGLVVGDWADSEGGQVSHTLDAAYTVTENGKTKTEGISVTLSIHVMFLPEKIVIQQMGVDSELLSQMEFTPGELPETFTPERNAAYLVVETHKQDAADGLSVMRDIYGEDDEAIETFSAREDGVCVKHRTQIMW